MIGTTENEDGSCTEKISLILADLPDDAVAAVPTLEEYIEAKYAHKEHFEKYDVNPLKCCGRQVFKKGKSFMKDIEDGAEVLKEYEEATKIAECKAGDRIVYVLESYWGLHTIHPGEIPSNWVKYGCLLDMGYHSNMNGMMGAKGVVKKVLKKTKFSQGCNLYEQSTNITDH
eukprot:4927114-Ditylum_brightwellii.AAC.1